MAPQGTKGKFQSWLAGKGLTLTKYNKLSADSKRAIYQEYQKKGGKSEAINTCPK